MVVIVASLVVCILLDLLLFVSVIVILSKLIKYGFFVNEVVFVIFVIFFVVVLRAFSFFFFVVFVLIFLMLVGVIFVVVGMLYLFGVIIYFLFV